MTPEICNLECTTKRERQPARGKRKGKKRKKKQKRKENCVQQNIYDRTKKSTNMETFRNANVNSLGEIYKSRHKGHVDFDVKTA